MKIGLKIRHKLFLALLTSSVLVAAGLFSFLQWNFDRGFLNYVNKQELTQLTHLAERLAALYKQENSWLFIRSNEQLWHRLHVETFFRKEGIRMPDNDHPFPPPKHRMPPPPKHGPESIGGRIVLFDADKQSIYEGLPEKSEHLTMLPISLEKATIGYLGLMPVKELSNVSDLLFVEQQTSSFALVTGVMLFISFLMSFLVTGHLLRPINLLIEGTQQLISGWFATRISVTSKDELGVLSTHFNNLASTLEENEKARQLWVADISHELRTPLAILQGEVEALQDGIQPATPEALSVLHGEILHLGRLVNDLYELSMTDIGALSYKKVLTSPALLLEETCRLFAPRFELSGLTLTFHPPLCSSSSMLADPDRLQQLFTNILQNSLKYTDSPGRVDIYAKTTANAQLFTFMDSGPGVTEEDMPHIFERLYRTEKSRNRAHGGAGLGLSICKNIVKAHQGTIEAQASRLGGLQISITLPLVH